MHNLAYRIGFDAGARQLEDALSWASCNDLHFVDFNADVGPNRLDNWDRKRVNSIRRFCTASDIHLGIHTLSGVNIAEFSPFMSTAVDEYLKANILLGSRLSCEWVTVHAGYHFSADEKARRETSLERLQKATEFAELNRQNLLLENLNFEPDDAEVHYIGHNVPECRYYFDSIESEAFGWAFTINHANLVPEGIRGFTDAFGFDRIGCVRLADNQGNKEVHQIPGEGNIDFADVFGHLESNGYNGHYTMAYGNDTDKIASREWLISQASTSIA